MSKVSIDLGASPNDNTGDPIRTGGEKINDNFSELYDTLGDGNDIKIGVGQSILSVNLSKTFIGIGTTNPSQKLDVRGNISVSGVTTTQHLLVTGVSTFNSIGSTSLNVSGNSTLNTTNISSLVVSGLSTFSGVSTVTGTTLFSKQLSVSGVSTFAGITTVSGNTLFSRQLSVSGFSTFAGVTTITGTTLFAKQFNVSGISSFTNTTSSTSPTTGAVLISGGLGVSGNINVGTALSVTGTSTFGVSIFNARTIFTTNTGIGTTNPVNLLQVGVATGFHVTSSGSIGIGTTIPTSQLSIVGDGDRSGRIDIQQFNSNTTDGPNLRFITAGGASSLPTVPADQSYLGRLTAQAYTSLGSYTSVGAFGFKKEGTGNGVASYAIETRDVSGQSVRFIIDRNANTGIGTTTPVNLLQVGVATGFHVTRSGSVGIGITNPTAKVDIQNGDLRVGTNQSYGLILTSQNGTKYRLVVSNSGALSTVAV